MTGKNGQNSGSVRLLWLFVVVLSGVVTLLSWRVLATPKPGGAKANAKAAEVIIKPRGALSDAERTTIDIFRSAAPSVVHITTLAMRRDVFSLDVTAMPSGTGSGFIWDREGHVVTNVHVLQNANAVKVTLADQSTWDATLVGYFAAKDIAVLKVKVPAEKLMPISFGTSHDLVVGQHVFAIGNPFGFDHTLSTGVISGLGREIKSSNNRPIQGVIQTDAAINPGNSGGPLLDSAGRLIGINTAIYSPSGASAGIGFAVPVDTVARVVPQLIEHGKVAQPGIGVSMDEDNVITRRLGVRGVLILNIREDGPAARAGLRGSTRDWVSGTITLGDIITSVNDDAVNTPADFYRALEKHKIGETVKLGILRERKTLKVSVALGEVVDGA